MNKHQKAKLSPEELFAHNAAVKERALAYQRKWRSENSDRYYAMQRARRAENPDKVKEQYIKHRDKRLAQGKEYAKKRMIENPEAVRAIRKRNYEKTKAIRHEKWAHRDALIRGCSIGDRSLIIPLYEIAVEMQRKTGVRWSVDHIIPLALGGAHDVANMQPMPLALNHTKSGNPFWISEDGKWKDWRSVPVHLWSNKFKAIYDSVVAHGHTNHLHVLMSA
jgi:hypothetical protein